MVEIDFSTLTDEKKLVNIILPARVLRQLDALVREAKETRSGYIAKRIVLASPA